MTRRAVWFIEACFIMLLSVPLALMPLSFAQKAGEKLGLLLFFVWRSRREIAIRNLSCSIENGSLRVSEPAEKIIRESFQNIGQSFAEVLKIYFGIGSKNYPFRND